VADPVPVKDDDGFGDFGGGFESSEKKDDGFGADDDGFGDFGETPSGPPLTTTPPEAPQTPSLLDPTPPVPTANITKVNEVKP